MQACLRDLFVLLLESMVLLRDRAGGGRDVDGGLFQLVPPDACGLPRIEFKRSLSTYLGNGQQVNTAYMEQTLL
jgi:hypothetical protein